MSHVLRLSRSLAQVLPTRRVAQKLRRGACIRVTAGASVRAAHWPSGCMAHPLQVTRTRPFPSRRRKGLLMAVPATVLAETLRTLPGDDVRHVMWRLSDRYDLQMLVQSVRQVARGPVARMVAQGARNSHDWTEQKNELLKHYDECGVTGVFMEPHQGGFLEGPKNLAMALAAFELAWV